MSDGATWCSTSPDCSKLNYREDDFWVSDTSAVGSYPAGASPYSVMDMAGNVMEWVKDWKIDRFYSHFEPDAWPANPVALEASDYKVLRGGAYHWILVC
jgi:serine/threonine-protein kinase